MHLCCALGTHIAWAVEFEASLPLPSGVLIAKTPGTGGSGYGNSCPAVLHVNVPGNLHMWRGDHDVDTVPLFTCL